MSTVQPHKLTFPTMLRKMWSGAEVQAWLDALPPLYAAQPGQASDCAAKALEFAEYLAKCAERLLAALDQEDSRRDELGDCPAVDQETDLRCEHARGLRDDIYEFRQRVAKVTTPAKDDAVGLEPVHGDVLPPIGANVQIHLGRQDAWLPHTVVGYFAWPDHNGNPFYQRVFVRVRGANGVLNARMVHEVRRPDGTHYVDPTPAPAGKEPEGAEHIWVCKIGGRVMGLPTGADAPMRKAIADAFADVTGFRPEFIFGGWGGELTEAERAIVRNRPPAADHVASGTAG